MQITASWYNPSLEFRPYQTNTIYNSLHVQAFWLKVLHLNTLYIVESAKTFEFTNILFLPHILT